MTLISCALVVLIGVGVGCGMREPRAGHEAEASAPGFTQARFGGDKRPIVLFTGDSFTEGVGANQFGSYAQQTANDMGWSLQLDAESATGFTNSGVPSTGTGRSQVMINRLNSDRARWSPAVVVVDGGRNDGHASIETVVTAAVAYVGRVHTLWPQAKIVFLAPSYVSVAPLGGYAQVLTERVSAAVGSDLALAISPSAEGWWTDVADPAEFRTADKVHPNPSGHSYIARRLVDDLRRNGLADVAPIVFTPPTPAPS